MYLCKQSWYLCTICRSVSLISSLVHNVWKTFVNSHTFWSLSYCKWDPFSRQIPQKLLQQWMVYIHHRYNPVSESHPCQRRYVWLTKIAVGMAIGGKSLPSGDSYKLCWGSSSSCCSWSSSSSWRWNRRGHGSTYTMLWSTRWMWVMDCLLLTCGSLWCHTTWITILVSSRIL